MKTIIPNIWMLLLRLVLLASFVYMNQWPLEKFQRGEYKNDPIIFIIAGLVFFNAFTVYILWTLCGVLWVTFSKEKTTIHFHYFYKTVRAANFEIDGFYKTAQNTKISKFNGLIIKLKDGKVVEVSAYNLQSLNSINNFLKDNSIPLRGNKDSWFPLKRKV